MRLTDLAIKHLKTPEKGAVVYADDTIPGFGVRVSEGGTKSFVLTHGVRRQRETLGRVGIITLKDARAEAKHKLAEYTLGKQNPTQVRWKDAVEEYLAASKKKLRDRTHTDYKYLLDKHFRLGETKISDLTPSVLLKNLDKLSDRPALHRYAFAVLRAFLNWAFKRHYLQTNIIERLQTPAPTAPRERVLTDKELRKVWIASGDDTYGVIVKLLILTGQRVGEVSKLSRDMVAKDTINLPSCLTKNGRPHSFPLGATARSILSARMAKQSSSLIFPARGKHETSFNGFSKSKVRLDKRSGVSEWTLHDLRRTFASGLASLGTPLPVVEKLLNHVSGSFAGIVGVYQRYSFDAEMRQALFTKLEDLITRVDLLKTTFRSVETKIRMNELMDTPNVVVIDNGWAQLTPKGSEFFGRLFLALILAAAHQRAGKNREDKLPVYVYMDEASFVIGRDAIVTPTIVQTCRSHNIAMIFAHQDMTQIQEPTVKAALANCAIRLANPDEDAKYLADSFRTSFDSLQNLERGSFALFIRDFRKTFLKIHVPNVPVSSWKKMLPAQLAEIREDMRKRYSFTPPRPAPSNPPEPLDDKPKQWG